MITYYKFRITVDDQGVFIVTLLTASEDGYQKFGTVELFDEARATAVAELWAKNGPTMIDALTWFSPASD